jgi:hypothetical protein
MKAFIFLSAMVIAVTGYAQPVYRTDSIGIRTDPRPNKAFNLERGTPFHNTFNWMSGSLAPVNMYMPYQSQTSFGSPFWNNNSDLNYLAFQQNSDFLPEDGWELIQWGFGKVVSGANEYDVSFHQRSVPIMVLYNRYTAMLHVFGAYNFGANQVFEVLLRFSHTEFGDGGRTGYKVGSILSYAGGIGQVLDEKTSIFRQRSRFTDPNDPIKFVHAAFPIAYDPCVSKELSSLRVYFQPVTEMKIDLYGRLLATSETVEQFGNNSPEYFHPDFLNSVYTEGDNVVAGAQIYRDASKMYTQLYVEMQAKGKLDIVAALDVLKAGLELGAEIIPSKPIKIAAKGVQFAQSIVKLKKASEPPKPVLSPSAIIRGEITLSGGITTGPTWQHATEIAVPGSKDSWLLPEANYTTQPYYPLYNEELGLLALLETPVVQRYRQRVAYTSDCNNPDRTTPATEYVTEEISYRLKSALKYAINPAARFDLDRSDVSVALVIRSKPQKVLPTAGQHSVAVQSLGNLEDGVDTDIFISPFVSVNCLDDLTVYLERFHTIVGNTCAGEDYFGGSIDTVFLRFANTYVSRLMGSGNVPVISTSIVTFPVIIENVTAPLPVSEKIPFNRTISSATNLNGNLRAWNSIKVTANLSSSSGLNLISGGDITIEPGVTISPNVSLLAGTSPIDCGVSNPPYTPQQLDTWCGTSQYQAKEMSDRAKRVVAQELALQEEMRQKSLLGNTLKIFPNPFEGEVSVTFGVGGPGPVKLSIFDLLGKEQMVLIENQSAEAGSQEHTFNLSALPAGLYLAVLETSQGRQTVRIVKE